MSALSLKDDVAATLQARMSWPQADACAADLMDRFTRMMRDYPLTCEYCRNSPATRLIVVDFEYSRVKAVVCEPCGRRSLPDAARVAQSAWLFALIPAGKPSDPVPPQEEEG
jgi:hypothetical protein